jgi:hypothetical protein
LYLVVIIARELNIIPKLIEIFSCKEFEIVG